MPTDYPYEGVSKIYSFGTAIGTAREPDLGDLLISWFGKDKIKSFAQAIDPFTKFKKSPHKPSEVTRRRVFPIVASRQRGVRSIVTGPRWQTFSKPGSFYEQGPVEYFPDPNPWDSYYPFNGQETLYGFINDTTRKSRPIGSQGGEFELFSGSISSSSRNYTRDPVTQTEVYKFDPFTPFALNGGKSTQKVITLGPSGRFSTQSLKNLTDAESSNADNKIFEHSLRLLKKCLPASRETSLFRSFVELRDLPATLKTLTENAMSGVKSSERISSQYLNYQFGVNPLIQDLVKLVDLPSKLAKRVNYLIARQGKDTTFRSSFRMEEGIENPPSFEYDVYGTELNGNPTSSTVGTRSIQMRMVVNANVEFPSIARPFVDPKGKDKERVKEILYGYYSGSVPRLVDFYNLVPWTWLIDWFTGLSDYLEVIDLINSDNSIVNWGYITYDCKGVLKSTYESKWEWSKSKYWDTYWIDESGKTATRDSSTFNYKYVKRVSLAKHTGVKTLEAPETLDPFRASIASALALQASGRR